MKAPTRKQLMNPDYWDRYAPKGAEYAYIILDGVTWYKRVAGQWFCSRDSEEWSASTAAVTRENEIIPRPTKPDAPEWVDGLPPEGADLEYDTHFGNWCPAKCIARGHDHSDPVAVIQTTNRIFIVSDSDRVRIRRTKRKRIGDALAEIIAKEIEIEFIDGNFHIETSSAIDYILSEYNLEPKP